MFPILEQDLNNLLGLFQPYDFSLFCNKANIFYCVWADDVCPRHASMGVRPNFQFSMNLSSLSPKKINTGLDFTSGCESNISNDQCKLQPNGHCQSHRASNTSLKEVPKTLIVMRPKNFIEGDRCSHDSIKITAIILQHQNA